MNFTWSVTLMSLLVLSFQGRTYLQMWDYLNLNVICTFVYLFVQLFVYFCLLKFIPFRSLLLFCLITLPFTVPPNKRSLRHLSVWSTVNSTLYLPVLCVGEIYRESKK